MSASVELIAVRDALNDQLGPDGIDYGALGDASRRLRALNMAEEASAARATGEAVEDALGVLQTLRALRGLLDALIDSNRATWDSVALLGIMTEMAAELLDEDPGEARFADLVAAPGIAARGVAAIRESARAHRRRAEFYGDRNDALTAEFMERVAALIEADTPPAPGAANVVRFPGRPRSAPRGGGAA